MLANIVDDTQIQDEPIDDASGSEDSVVDRAKRQGWIDEDEYRGDPDKWVDAETFLKRSETELPILRERLRRLDGKLLEQSKQMKETTETIKRFAEHHKKVSQRAYDKAKADLLAKQREAVEDGDPDAYDKTQKEIDGLKEDHPEFDLDAPVSDGSAQDAGAKPPHPEFAAWNTANKWYGTDMELTGFADTVGEFVVKFKPHLEGKAFFDEVANEVKQRFPDRFVNQRRQSPSKVSGGWGDSDISKGPKPSHKYSDLPADVRKECDLYVRNGLCSQDEFIANYEWD
jgi:hypothetical protein